MVDSPYTEEDAYSGRAAHGPGERRPIRRLAPAVAPAVAFLRDLARSLAL